MEARAASNRRAIAGLSLDVAREHRIAAALDQQRPVVGASGALTVVTRYVTDIDVAPPGVTSDLAQSQQRGRDCRGLR